MSISRNTCETLLFLCTDVCIFSFYRSNPTFNMVLKTSASSFGYALTNNNKSSSKPKNTALVNNSKTNGIPKSSFCLAGKSGNKK